MHVADASAPRLICAAPDAARAARLGEFLTAALPSVTVDVRIEHGVPRIADVSEAAAGPALIEVLERATAALSRLDRASEFRHSLNNPLAALLAEAQLLEMDAESGEQRAAASRIVGLCRRMVALLRDG